MPPLPNDFETAWEIIKSNARRWREKGRVIPSLHNRRGSGNTIDSVDEDSITVRARRTGVCTTFTKERFRAVFDALRQQGYHARIDRQVIWCIFRDKFCDVDYDPDPNERCLVWDGFE
jgi:hypothetical protein